MSSEEASLTARQINKEIIWKLNLSQRNEVNTNLIEEIEATS